MFTELGIGHICIRDVKKGITLKRKQSEYCVT